MSTAAARARPAATPHAFPRADEGAAAARAPEIELTWKWDDTQPYPSGRFFGHIAWSVLDIWETCAHFQERGVAVLMAERSSVFSKGSVNQAKRNGCQ